MLSQLKTAKKVVGVKQLRRALAENTAAAVFLAKDADPGLTEPLAQSSREAGIEPIWAASMQELGSACGISVGAAAAAILR